MWVSGNHTTQGSLLGGPFFYLKLNLAYLNDIQVAEPVSFDACLTPTLNRLKSCSINSS